MIAQQALAAGSFPEALTGGRSSADIRYRYETVDQNNTLKNARASTLRVRLGYETGGFKAFGALLEAEGIAAIGSDRYNSTVTGRPESSAGADPAAAEINQAYLSFSGIPVTSSSTVASASCWTTSASSETSVGGRTSRPSMLSRWSMIRCRT